MDRAWAVVGLALLACLPARAAEYDKPLTGTFDVWDADPEAEVPPSVYLNVSGEAAKVIYEGLSVAAEEDACQGGQTKWLNESGGFCNFAAETGEYFCVFGINLTEAKFAFGMDC
jgi:hypothetical protein